MKVNASPRTLRGTGWVCCWTVCRSEKHNACQGCSDVRRGASSFTHHCLAVSVQMSTHCSGQSVSHYTYKNTLEQTLKTTATKDSSLLFFRETVLQEQPFLLKLSTIQLFVSDVRCWPLSSNYFFVWLSCLIFYLTIFFPLLVFQLCALSVCVVFNP